MAQLEPLNLKITGTSAGLSAALGKAQTDINGFASKVDQQSQSITQRLSNIGASIGAIALPAGITAGLGFGLKLAGEAEQAKVAFEVLLGSGEAANKMLADLQKFAATTPFQFPEIRQSAQLLTAFGFSAEEVQQQLKVMGNIAAGTGQPITELAELIGKARVQNTIFSEDLNQLTGRGIPVLDLLAQRFGVTTDSVKKLASDGKIKFEDLNAALTALGDGSGRFAGLMEKQSATLLGTFSTLQDNVSAVATEIGTALIPAATAFVSKLSEWIEFIKSFDVSTVEATVKVTAFAGSFAAALLIIPKVISLATQLVAAIRAIGVASAITQALSGPKGWVTLAAGLALAAGAVYGVDQLFNGLNETQAKAVAGAEKVAKGQETVAKRAIEAADATKKVKSETDRWTESAAKLRTDLELPSETYARQIETLRESVRKGGLEWEYYERGVRKAVDALEASRASANTAQPRVKALDANSAEAQIQTVEFRLGITPGQINAEQLEAREKQIRDELSKFKKSIEGAADSTTPLQLSLDGVAEKAANANVDPLLSGLGEAAKRADKVREALTLSGLPQSLAPLQQSLDGVAARSSQSNVDPLLTGLSEAASRAEKLKSSLSGADSTESLRQSLDGIADKASKVNVDPLLAGLDEAAARSQKVRESLTLNGLPRSASRASDPVTSAATIAAVAPKATTSAAVQSPVSESSQVVAAIAKQGQLLTDIAKEQSQAQIASNSEVTRLLSEHSRLLSSLLAEYRDEQPETTVDL